MSKNKKKVLILLPKAKVGGPYNSQKRIMESDLQKDYFFDAIYIPRIRSMINPFSFLKLVSSIRKYQPNIIHSYGLQLDGFFMMFLSKIAVKCPVVLAIRGSSKEALKINFFLKILVGYLESWTIKKADLVYGVSNYVLTWPIVTKNAKYIYGSIYNFPFSFHKVQNTNTNKLTRFDLGIRQDAVVVISTGRITIDKGYKDLTDVIANYQWPDNVVFCIVGDGEYLNQMKKRINTSLKGEKVIFTGYVKNIIDYLSLSDIFVICTKHETLCNSIIEAGNFGLPVVASRVGGIPELINDTHTGFLFDSGNCDECAKILFRLVMDKSERQLIGNLLKQNLAEKINSKKICQQLDEVYLRVLNL